MIERSLNRYGRWFDFLDAHGLEYSLRLHGREDFSPWWWHCDGGRVCSILCRACVSAGTFESKKTTWGAAEVVCYRYCDSDRWRLQNWPVLPILKLCSVISKGQSGVRLSLGFRPVA